MKRYLIHDMVEMAMLIALAIVLDKFVKIPFAVTGGSINIAMVPLFILALRHGAIKSFVAGGIVFGFISCLLDGYGLVTYPCEYLLAFGSISLVGLFAKKILNLYESKKYVKSILLFCLLALASITIRFIGGCVDSMLIWEYELVPSIIYNLPYVYISGIACIIIVSLLLNLIILLNRKYKTGYLSK